MGNIFVFGDSIAAGAWDAEGGWPTRLGKKVSEYQRSSGIKFWSTVSNLSVSGDMVTDLISRVNSEYSSRRWSDPNNILIVAMGTNDSRLEGEARLPVISIEEFRTDLFKLSQKLRNTTKRVVILGLGTAIDSKLNPCSWANIQWQDARIKLFNDALQAWAEARGYVFVDIYSLTKDNQDFIGSLDDGLHPTDNGHQIIADEVFRVVKEKKYI